MPTGELRSFFRLLSGAADDGSAFSGRLAAMVKHAKTNGRIATKFPAQWRQQFMTWEQEMKTKARESYQEGCEDTRAETARKMLDEAIPVETVARCTGLPLEQVERLRREAFAVKA